VAAATGWSLSAVSMYERGHREASYERLLRLTELYGVGFDELFPRTGAQSRLVELEARVASLERALADRAP